MSGSLGRGLAMDGNWVRGFLAAEVQFKPGTHFVYNSFATYQAIIQKVSGETLLDYLTPRLFEPLGIENPSWETDPDGINTGGWGLSITTEDISKFFLELYLQKGVGRGKQLVSEEWVEEATKLQSSNGSNPESDWDQGYGYQFWRCRHNLYRGRRLASFCIVMPDQDAVLAITSGNGRVQKVMSLAWKHLLPP